MVLTAVAMRRSARDSTLFFAPAQYAVNKQLKVNEAAIPAQESGS
jgi:hypothetical protein